MLCAWSFIDLQKWNFPGENSTSGIAIDIIKYDAFKKHVSESRFYDKREDNIMI